MIKDRRKTLTMQLRLQTGRCTVRCRDQPRHMERLSRGIGRPLHQSQYTQSYMKLHRRLTLNRSPSPLKSISVDHVSSLDHLNAIPHQVLSYTSPQPPEQPPPHRLGISSSSSLITWISAFVSKGPGRDNKDGNPFNDAQFRNSCALNREGLPSEISLLILRRSLVSTSSDEDQEIQKSILFY
jgi:hypothetical protein